STLGVSNDYWKSNVSFFLILSGFPRDAARSVIRAARIACAGSPRLGAGKIFLRNPADAGMIPPQQLPCGVTVARKPLELLVKVRILARQPSCPFDSYQA